MKNNVHRVGAPDRPPRPVRGREDESRTSAEPEGPERSQQTGTILSRARAPQEGRSLARAASGRGGSSGDDDERRLAIARLLLDEHEKRVRLLMFAAGLSRYDAEEVYAVASDRFLRKPPAYATPGILGLGFVRGSRNKPVGALASALIDHQRRATRRKAREALLVARNAEVR